MNDIVDGAEKDKAWLNDEKVQISYERITELEDGSFRKLGEGEQFSEVFWNDAVTTTLHQTHPRVSTLKTELVCQYKFQNGRIYVKTLRYKMTTRYGNWDRANIDIVLSARDYVRECSDDNLLQDTQWHNHEVYLESPLAAPDFNMYLVIRVNYDGTNNDVGPDEGWGVYIRPAQKPLIETPLSGSVVRMPFPVSGKNGLLNGKVNLSCLYNGSVRLLASATVGNDGRWNIPISLPAGVVSFYAEQVIGNENSGKSNTVTIQWYAAPRVESPANNAVVATGSALLLKGRGTAGKTIHIMTPGGGVLHATTTVKSNDTWEALFNQGNYPNGGLVEMTAGHLNMNDWSVTQSFKLLGPPAITSPTQNQEVDMRITVGGTVNTLFKSGTVNIHRDSVGTLLGTATVNTSTGAWQAQLTTDLTPGDYSLTAVHVFSGVTSLGASPVRLKVRPPQPQLTAPNPASGVNPVLTGTGGHPGATLVLSDETEEDLGSVTVTGNSWSVSPRSALTPGVYAFKVRQSISNMLSLWSNVRTFSVIVPKPTLTVPITVTDQKPSFSGMANTWAKQTQAAQVEVRLNHAQTPIVPIVNVSNNRWTSTATERWAPGTYAIVIRQLYKTLNSGWPATAVSLVIPAPLPVITKTDPEGFSPRITGTCWPGASLKLRYSDRPTVDHPVSGTNGTWTFRRDIPFAPGNHTFTVTQSYGGQTSGEAHGAFNVPTPKLGITQPEVNQEVGLKPTFEGTDGYKDAVLTIYDAISDQALGSKTLSSSGSWSLTPEAELSTGLRTVYVRQSFNNQFSARSDNRNFQVVILAPRVGVPALDGRLPRLGLISGTGGIPGALITVKLAGVTDPVADNIPVRDDGSWEVPSRLTEVGQKTLLVSQTYKGQSSEIFQHPFTLVPAAPYLESPVNGQRISSQVMASGFGYPGDTVSVHRRGGSGPHLLATTQVRPEGTWSVEFTWNAEWTGYSLSVQAKKSEFGSDNSPMHAIKTRSAAPSLTQPASQDWVDAAPTFAGHGRSGAQIRVASYFDPGDVLATGLVANGSWSVQSSKSLPPGLHRVVVWQTEGEADSVELISEPFIVE
ncbi:Ig-like domain repeat protein [Pseudomonas sp. PICF141]|uniref:Ig-like domain repeat protein n=1 Tax=Pseudomonas sp. PICF141 TaxID=1949067 RepID=UPI000BABCF11|nr:Ig-like domain repeat protein [Pseudomonas sp. PICF141]PAU59348.1 hypothetical protein BZL43_10230 [Pseudomonas sp. PICF141]